MDKIIEKVIQEQIDYLWENCEDPSNYGGVYDSNPYGVDSALIGSSGGWQCPCDDSKLRQEVIGNLIDDLTPILEKMDKEVEENTKEILLSILKKQLSQKKNFLLTGCLNNYTNKECDMIEKTIRLIKVQHNGQYRKVSNEPYYTHPLIVMNLVKEYTTNEETLVVALLHDVLEDTEMTAEEMTKLYGFDITHMVLLLTNDDEEIKRIGKLEHIRNKFDKMCDTTLLIKLCDIQSNLMDNPSLKSIERNKELILHLEKTRNLTKDHCSVIKKIKTYI